MSKVGLFKVDKSGKEEVLLTLDKTRLSIGTMIAEAFKAISDVAKLGKKTYNFVIRPVEVEDESRNRLPSAFTDRLAKLCTSSKSFTGVKVEVGEMQVELRGVKAKEDGTAVEEEVKLEDVDKPKKRRQFVKCPSIMTIELAKV